MLFGGTSDLGVACIKEFITRGTRQVVLVSRESEYANIVHKDLEIRYPNNEFILVTYKNDVEEILCQTINRYDSDTFLVAFGILKNTKDIVGNRESLLQMNVVNIQQVSICIYEIAEILKKRGSGLLAVFGSVAGDRGRSSNYFYGATKKYLETVIEGLSQMYNGSKIGFSVIKPGPVRTRMTYELNSPGPFLADTDRVSKRIVNQLIKRKQTIYVPRFWRQIMFVIKFLPRKIFNRLPL